MNHQLHLLLRNKVTQLLSVSCLSATRRRADARADSRGIGARPHLRRARKTLFTSERCRFFLQTSLSVQHMQQCQDPASAPID